jgi:DNA-binding transcriptional MocR family regulator
MIVPAHYGISGQTAEEVAQSVEARLREGRLGAGDRLPPVRALAASLRLSPATAAAAYRLLRDRGLLTGDGRRGTRVTPRPPLALPRPDLEVPAHLRDLATGNPDRTLLPPLTAVLGRHDKRPVVYGEPAEHPLLLAAARAAFIADGIPAGALAVVGGAMDGIERVLQAHLRPGDRVLVEDPGYTGVLDLLGALGLVPEPIPLDELGLRPDRLAVALARGASACVLTPRAQNPTGAALDAVRARDLRACFGGHPEVLVVEDDHAGPVAGTPAFTTVHPSRSRFAVVRSVSKWLGPDLRLALLAGDSTTVARVRGRQAVGSGWVSHVLQEAVARLWTDRGAAPRLRTTARTYADRRKGFIRALADRGLAAFGRSGLNVWVPVPEEGAIVSALAAAGWAVRPGERYRLLSPPAVRVTVAALDPKDAARLAEDMAALLRPSRRTASA